MTRVLCVIHTNTYFAGLAKVAQAIQRKSDFQFQFHFQCDYPTLQDDLALCRLLHFSYSQDFGDVLFAKPAHTMRAYKQLLHLQSKHERYRHVFIAGRMFLKSYEALVHRNPLYTIWRYKLRLKQIRTFLHEWKVSLILLGGENVWYDAALYISIGHKLGIPSVIVPQWMANAREPAEHIARNPLYQQRTFLNWIAGKLYPRWLHVHNGKRLIRLPGEHVIARELLHLAPPEPWTLHSGYADAIAVESEAMRDYGLREHLPKEQLVVTGSIDDDILYETASNARTRKREVYDSYGFTKTNPLLVSALPPNFLDGEGRPDCEFTSYVNLVHFWVSSLVTFAKGYGILLSLHPSVELHEYQYLEKYGVRVTKEPITTLIPICDIFVASISSTIQWAIASGKPVINYDVYKYRYTDYATVTGVLTIETKDAFTEAVLKFSHDSQYLRTITKLQVANAKHWGVLDGKGSERLLHLLQAILQKYPRKDS